MKVCSHTNNLATYFDAFSALSFSSLDVSVERVLCRDFCKRSGDFPGCVVRRTGWMNGDFFSKNKTFSSLEDDFQILIK
jgi:hypothetical protein